MKETKDRKETRGEPAVVYHESRAEKVRRDAVRKFLGLGPANPQCLRERYAGIMSKALHEGFNALLRDGAYRQVWEGGVGEWAEALRTRDGVSTGTGVYFLESGDGARFIAEPSFFMHACSMLLLFEPGQLAAAQKFLRDLEAEVGRLRGRIYNDYGEPVPLDRTYGWDDIVVPARIRETVERHVLRFPEQREFFARHGISYKRGLIFHGPPGNGKTLMTKIIASISGMNMIWVSRNEEDLRAVYDFAQKLAPCVVLFEDIDLIAQDRCFGGSREIIGELVGILDGLVANDGVVTIATTNNPEVLDKALAARPGRFDLQIEFSNPDPAAREDLLTRAFSRARLEDGWTVRDMAGLTDRCSCAQVKESAVRALIAAGEDRSLTPDNVLLVRKEDFLKGMQLLGIKKTRMGFGADKPDVPRVDAAAVTPERELEKVS